MASDCLGLLYCNEVRCYVMKTGSEQSINSMNNVSVSVPPNVPPGTYAEVGIRSFSTFTLLSYKVGRKIWMPSVCLCGNKPAS